MNVSRNEMIAAVSRAYEGAGHQIGDYEDAAQLVTFSQMCGLGGFEAITVPPAGPKGGATPRLVFENDAMAVIDAGGADVCEHGSLAAHLAYAKGQTSCIATVQLANCRYPALIVGCLSLIAQQGVFVSGYWRDGDGMHGVSFEGGAVFPHYWRIDAPTNAGETSTITIICTGQPALLADAVSHQAERPGAQRLERTAPQIAGDYNQALEQGIAVTKQEWEALNAAAWPILVPSSDHSRAGAGPT
ncbi:MAG: DUF3726 domain-containing protein [Alphaproteobacteria bacterium]|nr:DUF3726 domain-containing protein [Alphaproteobacteria bacterium]